MENNIQDIKEPVENFYTDEIVLNSFLLMIFGTIFLFAVGIYFQYEFLQRLINRDIIIPTELEVEEFAIGGNSYTRQFAIGYIDSVRVRVELYRGDKTKKKNNKSFVPIWYNPISADIFLRRPKDNGAKFSIAIWSWYYFRWSLTILPQLFLTRLIYRRYKRYKEYKKIQNELKTKK